MNDKINTEQPLILQPQCVDCRFYDGFGACTEHGYQLRDNCEDFADMETIHKYVEDMENYEEKYKQALEIAKECLQDGTITTIARDYILEIFPELKENESEDERIKKAIIRILKGETRYVSKEDTDRYITWLEKQGEKKSDDEVMKIRRKAYSDGYMHGQDNIAIALGKESVEALEHFVRSIGESGYASPYDNRTKLVYRLLEQLKQIVK